MWEERCSCEIAMKKFDYRLSTKEEIFDAVNAAVARFDTVGPAMAMAMQATNLGADPELLKELIMMRLDE
jgi:hypothetical protein